MTEEEYFEDFEEISLSELKEIGLTNVPENISLQILENNFPQCYLTRVGNKLNIRIEEHIYTKYWFHKYHASLYCFYHCICKNRSVIFMKPIFGVNITLLFLQMQ